MQVLRARFTCRAAFARFIHAHELTSRALRRGRVRYHRAASILNRWAAESLPEREIGNGQDR